MLEGMEHVKCCGNCINFLVLDKECNRGDIGSSYIQCAEFYYCDEFELTQIKVKGSTMPNADYNGNFTYGEVWSKGVIINNSPEIEIVYILNNKDKLIYNMARYIASKDIDFDICTPMCNEWGCLMEKQYNDGIDCGLDICIECVKNWFSDDK